MNKNFHRYRVKIFFKEFFFSEYQAKKGWINCFWTSKTNKCENEKKELDYLKRLVEKVIRGEKLFSVSYYKKKLFSGGKIYTGKYLNPKQIYLDDMINRKTIKSYNEKQIYEAKETKNNTEKLINTNDLETIKRNMLILAHLQVKIEILKNVDYITMSNDKNILYFHMKSYETEMRIRKNPNIKKQIFEILSNMNIKTISKIIPTPINKTKYLKEKNEYIIKNNINT